jgi:hypothetical protein
MEELMWFIPSYFQHLNLTEFSIANTMIFADGFIGYSLYEEDSFMNDETILERKRIANLGFT